LAKGNKNTQIAKNAEYSENNNNNNNKNSNKIKQGEQK
jgi:hypothetical protein